MSTQTAMAMEMPMVLLSAAAIWLTVQWTTIWTAMTVNDWLGVAQQRFVTALTMIATEQLTMVLRVQTIIQTVMEMVMATRASIPSAAVKSPIRLSIAMI